MTEEEYDKLMEERHRIACLNKERTYTDILKGYDIFTEYYLKNRGFCCHQCCHHCPYGSPDTPCINSKAASENLGGSNS